MSNIVGFDRFGKPLSPGDWVRPAQGVDYHKSVEGFRRTCIHQVSRRPDPNHFIVVMFPRHNFITTTDDILVKDFNVEKIDPKEVRDIVMDKDLFVS